MVTPLGNTRGRHHETALEKWQADGRYYDYLRSRAYATPSPLDLYPGHAAYSGLQPHLPGGNGKGEDKYEKLPEEKTGDHITSDPQGSGPGGLGAVDDLLAGKLEGLHDNIERIRYQLDHRERLKRRNIYDIDKEMMQRKTELFQCDNWTPGTNSLIERRRSDLEGQLQQMRKEKRLEEVASWRDRQRLLTDLRDIIDDYRDAFRRKDLISGGYAPLRGEYER